MVLRLAWASTVQTTKREKNREGTGWRKGWKKRDQEFRHQSGERFLNAQTEIKPSNDQP